MKIFRNYKEVQAYIKSSGKKRFTFDQIRAMIKDSSDMIQQYLDDKFVLDDVLFAIKRNIELVHHYCPVCGNEIHVYCLQHYPATCSVSCGVQNSQELRIKNSLKKYGTERPLQSQEVKDKVKNTMFERYGGYTFQSQILMDKVKKTNLERYGVEISASNTELHKKNEETCLKKYGVTHTSKLPENRQKARETNLRLHGSENYNNKEKARQTCLERYGTENPTQCHDIRVKEQSRYKYQNINFDSSWELALYIWLVDHSIDFQYQPDTTFSYSYNGKTHVYHPDFLINGEIYEVKGDQYFALNEDGSEKMVCPYNHSMDNLYQAKYECMLQNNIKILRAAEIKKYLDYVNKTYDIMYLQQFKRT